VLFDVVKAEIASLLFPAASIVTVVGSGFTVPVWNAIASGMI
jgi:hypothetical protein